MAADIGRNCVRTEGMCESAKVVETIELDQARSRQLRMGKVFELCVTTDACM